MTPCVAGDRCCVFFPRVWTPAPVGARQHPGKRGLGASLCKVTGELSEPCVHCGDATRLGASAHFTELRGCQET